MFVFHFFHFLVLLTDFTLIAQLFSLSLKEILSFMRLRKKNYFAKEQPLLILRLYFSSIAESFSIPTIFL